MRCEARVTDHEVLPERQELLDDVRLTRSVWLPGLGVSSSNWLVYEDDVAAIGPGPRIWDLFGALVCAQMPSQTTTCRPICTGLPYHRSL